MPFRISSITKMKNHGCEANKRIVKSQEGFSKKYDIYQIDFNFAAIEQVNHLNFFKKSVVSLTRFENLFVFFFTNFNGSVAPAPLFTVDNNWIQFLFR